MSHIGVIELTQMFQVLLVSGGRGQQLFDGTGSSTEASLPNHATITYQLSQFSKAQHFANIKAWNAQD